MKQIIGFLLAFSLATSQAFAVAKIQNEDVKSLAQVLASGGTKANLINDTKLYVTANGINQQLSEAIASGLIGGAGASYGLLANGGFELPTVTQGWTVGPGITLTPATNSFVDGTKSGLLSSGGATIGSGVTILSQTIANQPTFAGASIEAAAWFLNQTGTASLEICVGSSSTIAIGCGPLSVINIWNSTSISAPAPASNLTWFIRTTSVGTVLGNVDLTYIGINRNIGTVAQAVIAGGMSQEGLTTCASRVATGSTSEGTFNDIAVASGTCNPWVATGAITAPANLDYKPTYANMPAADYEVTVNGFFLGTANGQVCNYRISDGTTNFGYLASYSAGSTGGAGPLVGKISYSTAASRTFKIVAASSISGNCTITTDNAGRKLEWTFKKFPSQSEQVVRANLSNWLADASFYATDNANTQMGIGATSVFSSIGNANGIIVQNPVSTVSVGATCTTNAGTPGVSTCASGAEVIGFTFAQQIAGKTKVCVSFSHGIGTNASSGTAFTAALHKIDPANGTTVQKIGEERTNSYLFTGAGSTNATETPHKNCSVFDGTSGQQVYKLYYTQSQVGTPANSYIVTDRNVNIGARDVHFTAEPADQSVKAFIPGALVASPTVLSGGASGNTTFEEGTYTASWSTLTNINSLTSTNGQPLFYTRIGKTLTVWGSHDVSSLAANTQTNYQITLPAFVANNFLYAQDCVGFTHNFGGAYDRKGKVNAINGSTKVVIAYITGTSTAGDTQLFNFTCTIR